MMDCMELFKKHLITLLNKPNCLLFVAVYSDEIIGYILANIRELPPVYVQQFKVEIDSVSVIRKYKKKGIFRGLLSCIEKEADRYGIESIELLVAWENPNKQAYLKSGSKVRQEMMVKQC